MGQRYSPRRKKDEKVDQATESPSPVVVATPRAIVRGPDGAVTWVAQCPRCSDRNDETIVAGREESVPVQCQTCGAIVELHESGIYRAATTVPPPKE
jgi:ribosomal protein S27E